MDDGGSNVQCIGRPESLSSIRSEAGNRRPRPSWSPRLAAGEHHSSLEFAIEHGVDVLELDLAVTKDNVLVVSHNPTLAPNSFPGERICKGLALAPDTPIHSMALAEVRPDFSLATPEQ
jgi:hypothetical protein